MGDNTFAISEEMVKKISALCWRNIHDPRAAEIYGALKKAPTVAHGVPSILVLKDFLERTENEWVCAEEDELDGLDLYGSFDKEDEKVFTATRLHTLLTSHHAPSDDGVREAVEELEAYLEHRPSCDLKRFGHIKLKDTACSCGLDQTLAALTKEKS